MNIGQRARDDDAKLERRRQILLAAQRLLADNSFNDISMVDIGKAAGVVKGTLYIYFASKEALVLELTEIELNRLFCGLAAELDRPSVRPGEISTLIIEQLRQQPMLRRYLSILHTTVEHNITDQRALAFKQFLLNSMQNLAAILTLQQGWQQQASFRFLLQVHTMIIGLEHVASPCHNIERLIQSHAHLEVFQIDFYAELKSLIDAVIPRPIA